MQQATELKKQLQSIHRKSYPAYKSLKGSYQFGHYILSIDHVQGDPFAAPSRVSVHIPEKQHRFPTEFLHLPPTSVSIFPAKMPVFRMPTAKTISHVSPLPTI